MRENPIYNGKCGDYETDFSSTSPEYGTDGFYAKCWIRRENGIYLLKTGSDSHEIEPFSDFYASQLSEVICPEAVNYEMGEWHGKIVFCCPDRGHLGRFSSP